MSKQSDKDQGMPADEARRALNPRRREIKRGDFLATIYSKSFAVCYKGVWSKVLYLRREPTDADVDFLHEFARDLWNAGRDSLKNDIKELIT